MTLTIERGFAAWVDHLAARGDADAIAYEANGYLNPRLWVRWCEHVAATRKKIA